MCDINVFWQTLSLSISIGIVLWDSFQLPVLEGRPNVTALDLQIKDLRDAAVKSIEQMAVRIKKEATDIKATIGDIEDWLDRLKQLAEEVRAETKKTKNHTYKAVPMWLNEVCLQQPQNSMPDVIIWMMRGEKRVAYARVPANEVLYSNFSEEARGKHCGRTQTIFMQVRD